MKYLLISFVSLMFLASCSGSIGSISMADTLDWTFEPAGAITVRGREYQIEKGTGRDEDTGEIFVVEYRTKVDGRRVTCVGDINNCTGAIERELDSDKGDSMY